MPLSAPTGFVGRAPELVRLRGRLDAARQGRGGLMLVAGEPGIGKTRLLTEFATNAANAGWQVLAGHAYETEGMPSYLPFIEALTAHVRTCPARELEIQLDAGAAGVALLLPDLRQRLPEGAGGNGEGAQSSVSPQPGLLGLSAQSSFERYRLFESMATFFLNIIKTQVAAGGARRSKAAPGLLLTLDDLQWADAPTLLLLQHLVRRVAAAPLLVVGACRSVGMQRNHPLAMLFADLHRERLCERLVLNPFSQQETAAYVAGLSGGLPAAAVTEAIHRRTGGNAFFIEEVTGQLQAEGRDLAAAETISGSWSVPEGARDVIGRRLTRLSPEAQRLLQTGAVLGEGFRFEVLVQILDLPSAGSGPFNLPSAGSGPLNLPSAGSGPFNLPSAGSGPLSLPAGAWLDALDEAVRGGLLQEQGERYHFRHDLIRETLYEEQSLARRRLLHLAAAETIERLYASTLEREVTALASHYRLAGAAATDRARAYAIRAASAARAVYAWEDASAQYEAALTPAPDDARQRCDLLLALGETLLPAGEPERVFAGITPDAFAIAEGLADRPRAYRACALALEALFRYGAEMSGAMPAYRLWAERADRFAEPGTSERVATDIALANIYSSTGRRAEGRALRERALDLSGRLHDGQARFAAALRIIERPEAPQHHEQRLRLTEELAARPLDDVNPSLLGVFLWNSGCHLLDWGHRAQAEAMWRRGAELAARTQDANLLLYQYRRDAMLALLDGRLTEAVAAGARLLARANELGAPVRGRDHAMMATLRPLLYLGRGQQTLQSQREFLELAGMTGTTRPELPAILAHLGRMDEARALLRPLLQQREDIGHPENLTALFTLAWLFEAAVLVGDREGAATLASRLAGLSVLATTDMTLTCLARHLGAAAALLGDHPAARARYEKALEVAAAIGFRPEIALTRLQLAELLASPPGRLFSFAHAGENKSVEGPTPDLPQTEHPTPNREEVLEHLAFAIGEFEAMQMQPALERALALRDRLASWGTIDGQSAQTVPGPRLTLPSSVLGSRSVLSPRGPDGLTAREVEVLRLLAGGYRNKEIAAALVLSPATVRRHTINLYSKIGARGRTEAAAYAFRHGLAQAPEP